MMSSQKAQEAYLRETKALMRSKLEEHGVTITDDTPFRSYVNGIDEAVANSAGADEELAAVKEKLVRLLDIPTLVDSVPEAPLHLSAEDLAGVYMIRRYALYQHYGLVGLEIPENVVSVEGNACNGCTSLETLTIPKKLKLQSGCFLNCTGLKQVYLPTITDASERPVLNSNTVFPPYEDAPDCDFIINGNAAYELYNADTRWSTVLLNRAVIISEVTEE